MVAVNDGELFGQVGEQRGRERTSFILPVDHIGVQEVDVVGSLSDHKQPANVSGQITLCKLMLGGVAGFKENEGKRHRVSAAGVL